MERHNLWIKSTLDATMQPSIFFKASKCEGNEGEKRPLLVALHTWSYDRRNQLPLVEYAEKYNYHLLLPNFRGSNLKTNPECAYACGSVYAMQDIKDAIDMVCANHAVDEKHIYLYGAGGGGHMAFMMASFWPELFRAIAAFAPITDLKAWAEENADYREHILACCSNDETEMIKRSPINYIDTIAKANVKIFHGNYDPIVSVTHSRNLFEKVFQKYPCARVCLDVFDGGHESDMETAMDWFVSQAEDKEIRKKVIRKKVQLQDKIY